MKAVIMAGGEGTRIRSIAGTHPKSMVRVQDRPILWHQISNLRDSGIKDIILVTGFLGEEIGEYFGKGEELGVNITYFHEPYPMGTGGALFVLRDTLDEDFILLMGDLMLSVDFERFKAAHEESPALVTLFVHPNSHPFDSDIIVTDEVGSVADFDIVHCGIDVPIDRYPGALSVPVTGFIGKKAERPRYYHNLVNAGIYMISPEALELIPEPKEGQKTDIDRDIVRPLIDKGAVYAYRSTEYVKDMGTPERYEEVSRAAGEGIIEARNLRNPQKCIFLDRDGTINVFKGVIADPEQIELIPGAARAIASINASGYLAILITNQPVIARGDAGFDRYDEIEQALETALGAEGAYLDAAYYCPHHPDLGYEVEVKELKFACHCRKPQPGMILRAQAEHHIDLSSSYMAGDYTCDIAVGARAGVRTIGLRTGGALADAKYADEPDIMADDLYLAVTRILQEETPHYELLMVKDLKAMEEGEESADMDISIFTEEAEEDGAGFIRGIASSKGSELGFRMYRRQACLYGVLTYDSFLRQGYASRLIRYVCGYLRDHGIEEAVLHVSDTNIPACALYRSLGFTVREKVPAEDPE